MNHCHRVSTPRGGKVGGRCFFCQIEPNFSLPSYCIVVEGCQAGGRGHLLQYMRECNGEISKQGSKRFNSFAKTIHFAHHVILFIYDHCQHNEKFPEAGHSVHEQGWTSSRRRSNYASVSLLVLLLNF